MQIVIDIPEEDYKNCIKYDAVTSSIYKAIQRGTLLPKGHGRIKDIDKIEWYGCTSELDCPHKNRECKDCDRAECSKTQVDGIPTIVEADKEQKDE